VVQGLRGVAAKLRTGITATAKRSTQHRVVWHLVHPTGPLEALMKDFRDLLVWERHRLGK
jgi:hypothetical protein